MMQGKKSAIFAADDPFIMKSDSVLQGPDNLIILDSEGSRDLSDEKKNYVKKLLAYKPRYHLIPHEMRGLHKHCRKERIRIVC